MMPLSKPISPENRLVVVSNRLPVTVVEEESGSFTLKASSGGLVTALEPVLKQRKGVWIGWTGNFSESESELSESLRLYAEEVGYGLVPVFLQKQQVEEFYGGFSNQIIWPLFHDLQSLCNFQPSFWESYQKVELQYAEVVASSTAATDTIWVQDFHLMGLGEALRKLGLANNMGFFLHIPFPPPDIFLKLPWREDVIKGLLAFDQIGFQTSNDHDNFLACCRKLGFESKKSENTFHFILSKERRTVIGAFPIGIDFNEFNEMAGLPQVQARAGELMRSLRAEKIIVSVDRLDYTKGIVYRLRSFASFLKRYPQNQTKVSFIQLVIPSREDVDKYQELKKEIEQLVTQINGEYGDPGNTPVQHFFRSVTREELIAYYLIADIALVTPLKDGMNLVAKEFCAAQVANPGVLILSEFAGAASQLAADALLVNPYDIEGVGDAIQHASVMPQEDRAERIKNLRLSVSTENVFVWADDILSQLEFSASADSAEDNLDLDMEVKPK